MELVCSIYVGLLFFVLTPGILLSLPKRGSKYMVAATHALVFAAIYYFTHRMVWRIEGFSRPVAVNPKSGSTSINIASAGVKQTATTKANLICKDASGRVTANRDAQGNCIGTTITSGK